MVFALPDDRGEPIADGLKALLISPNQGVIIRPGVWHSQPIPSVQCKELPFLEKYNAVNAKMELDLFEECRDVISVQIDGNLKF